MQLIWLVLLALQTTLIAHNNSTPAERILAQQSAFLQQEPKALFTAEKAQGIVLKEVSNYHLLQLDQEQSAALRYEAPNLLKLNIPMGEGALELQLEKVATAPPVVVASSVHHPVSVEHAVHYRGIIAGDPGSLVAFSFLEDDVIGLISAEQLGGNYVLGRLPEADKHLASPGTYVLYQDREVFRDEHFSCATSDSGEQYLREELSPPTSGGRDLSDCVQVYFEVNHDIFLNKGSVQATVQYVEALFNQVATLYASEQINLSISEIMVWDTPSPYSSSSSGQMLTDFQNTRTSFNGDLAQLLSYQAGGGIAVVNGLCHPYTLAR